MNIYEKMLAITSELSAVAKNLKVGEGKSSYKAVGEADVLAAVKPLEEKYKVYSYPFNRKILSESIVTTKKSFKEEITESNRFVMRLETTYRFVNIKNPEEFIDIISYGDGIDSGDKAPGKAMTYSDKYALLKAYKIITGDDPDQNPSEEYSSKSTKEYKSVKDLLVEFYSVAQSKGRDRTVMDKWVSDNTGKTPDNLSYSELYGIIEAVRKW